MNNILLFVCIHFLLVIVLDASTLKLIPGDRNVVKKDGVTHTISKYYVVPNDFKLNKDANNKRYTKNMDQDIVSEENYRTVNNQLEEFTSKDKDLVSEDHYVSGDGQLGEYKVTINNNGANLPNDTSVSEVRVASAHQADGNAGTGGISTDAWASMNTQQALDTESTNLGNLQIEPISYNDTNNSSTENNLRSIRENANDSTLELNTKKQIIVDFDAEPSTERDFALVVIKNAYRNLDNFWGVLNNYMETVSDKDEQFVKIEKLFVLLNIFTRLYKATQLHIPIDGIIDNIINILETADIENTDGNNDGSQIKPTQSNNIKLKRPCLRKCQLKFSKANLDSKGVSISETDGRMVSDDIQNANLDTYLQRRDSNGDNVNVMVNLPSSSSKSNKPYQSYIKYIDNPVTIQRSLLMNPNNLGKLKGVPDGFNVRSASIATPKEKQLGRENSVYEENKLNLNILDTVEASKLPYGMENVKINSLPRIKEDIQYSDLPWHIEDKINVPYSDLPWHIEDKINAPYSDLPWHIEDKINAPYSDLPWHIEDKINMPYTKENKIVKVPVRFYQPDGSKLTISDDKILLDSNQTPLTSTANGLTVKDRFGKPYLYTYVINPTKFLYNGPETGSNIVKIKSGIYNNNYKTELENGYDIYNKYDQEADSKVMIVNAPASGYYESELSLSEEPSFVYSNGKGYYSAQSQIEKDIDLSGYDGNNNPEFQLSYAAPNLQDSKITIELEKEIENNPSSLLGNSPSYEEKDNVLLPNVPSTSNEPKLNIIENEEISQLIDEAESYIDNVSPLPVPLNDYHTQNNPTIWHSNIPSHEHLKIKKEYNLPITGNDGEIDIKSEIMHSYQPYGQAYPTKPTITYLQANQLPVYNYVDRLKAKLAPSYQLFSTENLLKLHDALIKKKQMNEINVYEDRALSNLRKINIILLTLAEHLGENKLSNRWYEKIFYNLNKSQHPLQGYVYNLLRQKWLHEIMLILYNNNFNLNILNYPRLYSFLNTWRFPTNVLKFLETEEILPAPYRTPNLFEVTYGAHNVIHDDMKLLEENLGTQGVLDKTIVDNYMGQNEGIILSVTGFNAGLDANIIIDILKKYLLYKNYVEKQEHVIDRGNRIEMLKQVALFLNEKGYGGRTVIDLIRKLYRAVYSVEGGGCSHTQYNDLVQNVYDVIVPVLRRSAQ